MKISDIGSLFIRSGLVLGFALSLWSCDQLLSLAQQGARQQPSDQALVWHGSADRPEPLDFSAKNTFVIGGSMSGYFFFTPGQTGIYTISCTKNWDGEGQTISYYGESKNFSLVLDHFLLKDDGHLELARQYFQNGKQYYLLLRNNLYQSWQVNLEFTPYEGLAEGCMELPVVLTPNVSYSGTVGAYGSSEEYSFYVCTIPSDGNYELVINNTYGLRAINVQYDSFINSYISQTTSTSQGQVRKSLDSMQAGRKICIKILSGYMSSGTNYDIVVRSN